MIDYIRVEKNRMYSEISLDGMIDVEGHESMANVLSFRSQKSAIKTDYKIENQQFMSRVKGLFSKMNKTQKQIAELFLLSDVSQVEIAKIMDIPINSVKGNLTRIREIVGSNFEAERVEYGFKDILAKNSYKQ
jgi:DNA-directed RNA polymerase specialized sigma24 family protein